MLDTGLETIPKAPRSKVTGEMRGCGAGAGRSDSAGAAPAPEGAQASALNRHPRSQRACIPTALYSHSNPSGPLRGRPRHPLIPAVLQRLPPEVEYTFLKMILEDVPGPLMTTLWVDNQAADDVSRRFQQKTYGAVDRALRRAEAALARQRASSATDQLASIRALRHAWVQQAVGETGGLPLTPGTKWIETAWTDPSRLGLPLEPTGLEGPGLVIAVRQLTARGARLCERWVVPAALMPWRPGGVPWIDPDFVD